jgi:probable addiction module antidote protein
VEIRHYVTATGVDPFQQWLDGLKDMQGRIAIQRRIDRVLTDNFGDHKFCPGWRLGTTGRSRTGIPDLLRSSGKRGGIIALWGFETKPNHGYHQGGSILERLSTEKTMTRRSKTKLSRSHEEATIESFRKDPMFAAEFLNAVLEDGNQEELMLALRRMSKAFGGVTKIASKSKLNPNTLYRTLSPQGNPELKSLKALLNAMGMQLTVRPLERKRVA